MKAKIITGLLPKNQNTEVAFGGAFFSSFFSSLASFLENTTNPHLNHFISICPFSFLLILLVPCCHLYLLRLFPRVKLKVFLSLWCLERITPLCLYTAKQKIQTDDWPTACTEGTWVDTMQKLKSGYERPPSWKSNVQHFKFHDGTWDIMIK